MSSSRKSPVLGLFYFPFMLHILQTTITCHKPQSTKEGIIMNDYDKKESESMLLYMKEKAEENFNELFLHPYNYYTDAVIKRAETSISAIETAVLGPANKRERSALNADAAHIKAGNDILQTYLETMGRNCPSFDAFSIEKATRYGDPHYVGQVLLRERRALYALKSYLATAGMTPEEMCDKYKVDISACGPKRMGDIRRHIKPNRYLPFKITRSFRIRNKATDDAFYALKKAEDYDDAHMHIAYNGTITASMPGIIFNGMKIDKTVQVGLLNGNAAYLTFDPVKALLYSDLIGAKWKGGQSKKAYLGVYKVLYKNPMHLDAYSPQIGGVKKTRETLRPYDAIVAHKGYLMAPGRPLKSGELSIYDERQITLMYVVEVEAA